MGDFKFRNFQKNQRRRILLLLSFGSSSLVLLHLLHEHVTRQLERIGHQAYEVDVLHIDESSLHGRALPGKELNHLQVIYPKHSYHVARLEDIFPPREDGEDDKALLGVLPQVSSQLEPANRLRNCLLGLPSASSVEDVMSILRIRLAVHKAKSFGCEAIFWGDSTTRLAEKTLAETAKGRGFSLPWQINSTSSPHGVVFMYPLRDILRKELELFADLLEPSLKTFICNDTAKRKPIVSSRNSSIDELMTLYFESVEQNYPSIISNVVRTGSKLQPSDIPGSSERCAMCGLPAPKGSMGTENWEGNQRMTRPEASGESQTLCYGCCRSLQGSKDVVLPS